ncbi:MAG: DUF4465 domain-containing protein [Pirellulales bacterium]|nr:DUF4465 domain-containing protein [Pirellulales bacterium]
MMRLLPIQHSWQLLLATAALVVLPASAARAIVIDFEDLTFTSGDYEAGLNLAGSFASGGAKFNNFAADFGAPLPYFEGFAYSKQNLALPAPVDNSTFPGVYDPTAWGFDSFDPAGDGGGAGSSTNYAVAYVTPFSLPDARITLPEGVNPTSVELTNVAYAALVMRDGDPNGFSRKFGTPPSGQPPQVWPDWLKLSITGLDAGGSPLAAAPVEFYLADYRQIGGAAPYIVDSWTKVDLSSLAGARYLVLTESGSDHNDFGLATPAYVALDNLVLTPVPEPATCVLAGVGAALVGLAARRGRGSRRAGGPAASGWVAKRQEALGNRRGSSAPHGMS